MTERGGQEWYRVETVVADGVRRGGGTDFSIGIASVRVCAYDPDNDGDRGDRGDDGEACAVTTRVGNSTCLETMAPASIAFSAAFWCYLLTALFMVPLIYRILVPVASAAPLGSGQRSSPMGGDGQRSNPMGGDVTDDGANDAVRRHRAWERRLVLEYLVTSLYALSVIAVIVCMVDVLVWNSQCLGTELLDAIRAVPEIGFVTRSEYSATFYVGAALMCANASHALYVLVRWTWSAAAGSRPRRSKNATHATDASRGRGLLDGISDGAGDGDGDGDGGNAHNGVGKHRARSATVGGGGGGDDDGDGDLSARLVYA
jgi:hypothetical protein